MGYADCENDNVNAMNSTYSGRIGALSHNVRISFSTLYTNQFISVSPILHLHNENLSPGTILLGDCFCQKRRTSVIRYSLGNEKMSRSI